MQVLHLKPLGSHLRDFIECTRFDSFLPLYHSVTRRAREINPKRGTKSHFLGSEYCKV